jgi:hypothetical protein
MVNLGDTTSSALCDADLVSLVLTFLGRDAGLFAFANKSWRASYAELYGAVRTSYAAVFSSPTRVEWVQSLGFRFRQTDRWQGWASNGDHLQWHRFLGVHADLPTLQTASKLGLPLIGAELHGAVQSRQLNKVIWLYEKLHCGVPSDKLMEYAGAVGSVEILQWLVEQGGTLSPSTVPYAARAGAVEVFELLQQQNVQFNVLAMQTAARYGRLPLIKWLRAAGCRWNSAVAARAAQGGHVEIVRFLHDNGCPWSNKLVCEYAVRADDSVPVLNYLAQLGALSEAAELTHALLYAGAHNNLAAAQWLRERGAEWPPVLYVNGHTWHSDVVAWARAQGCTSPLRLDVELW